MQSTLGCVRMLLLMLASLRCGLPGRRAAPLAGLTLGPQHSAGERRGKTCKKHPMNSVTEAPCQVAPLQDAAAPLIAGSPDPLDQTFWQLLEEIEAGTVPTEKGTLSIVAVLGPVTNAKGFRPT